MFRRVRVRGLRHDFYARYGVANALAGMALDLARPPAAARPD
jgi:hypothetical protein